ncbi:antirestriction protein [Trinickia violacea]|uniref:Antirestriction protein n=1 Tax=Trinickia violacea TaxID=2571746 RepID=A0A4P8J0F4_9BURK|nr:antirestriction protein [Trinickia violacea]QCP55142.1 antirestriction protein [Trinickia violacea]
MNEVNAVAVAVTSSVVPDRQREGFFPRHLGRYFLQGEGMMFDWARRLSVDYNGGSWTFFDLSNGGFFAAPDHHGNFHVEWNLNSFIGDLPAESFGIVVTLFALCHLAELTSDDAIIERFHLLREFALTHKDAAQIFRAID